MEDFAPFTLSILLTEEEYVASAGTPARRVVLTPTGAVLAVAGALLYRLTGLSALFSVGVVTLGLLLILCEWTFLPLYARVRAAAQYERQQSLRQALTVTVAADAFTVESARLSGRLPVALLTGAAQTPTLFSFTFGAECCLRIPRRLLTPPQETVLQTMAEKTPIDENSR